MERFLSLLLASALGGAAGGFVMHLVGPARGGGSDVAAGASEAEAKRLGELLSGIEQRIEALASEGGAAGRPGLRGAPPGRPLAPRPGEIDEATLEVLSAKLAERMEDTVKKAVSEAVESGSSDTPRRERRKRVSLAEAAKQLELSTTQEEQLRELYGELENEVYTMLAGKDGDPEEVRRDVQTAKDDPAKTMEVVGKYIPKAMGNLGGFMALEVKRQQRTNEIVGPEKADRMRREFSIEEQDPLGMEGGFNLRAGR
ncbi:MAG: hypothetical protein AB7T63_14435 [Planctomycetota bacterium]